MIKKPVSKYQQQALDFLEKTQTLIAIEFQYKGPYFDDEKENRNVYKISLKRNGKIWAFRFGQSIEKSERNIPPTAYDVLSTLTKYDPGTFEDFCSGYGYDPDSRKAEKTYFAVQKEYAELCKMFNEQEREEMAEIQ